MLHIVGTLTATTHIHQTDPNREGNLSRTIKTHLWDVDRIRREVPIVTANSVRGLLRRAAADVTLEAIGKPVSRAVFSVLTTGKASKKDIGYQPTTKVLVDGGKHIFAGLFGGGGYMLPSRYGMSTIVPIVEWCDPLLHPSLRDRAIPKDRLSYEIKSGADQGRVFDVPLVTQLILTSRDDVLAGKGQQFIEDYQQSVDAWIERVTSGRVAKATSKAEIKAAKDRGEKSSGVAKEVGVDVSGYNLIEAMLPGTPLQFWMRLNPKVTPAQVGLMLMAIRNWANANVLGGASARGFGRFNADLWLHDDRQPHPVSLFGHGDHVASYDLNTELQHYLDAANAELGSLNIEQIEAVYGTKLAESNDG